MKTELELRLVERTMKAEELEQRCRDNLAAVEALRRGDTVQFHDGEVWVDDIEPGDWWPALHYRPKPKPREYWAICGRLFDSEQAAERWFVHAYPSSKLKVMHLREVIDE